MTQQDEEWVAQLKGERGAAQRLEAFTRLGEQLYPAVVQYLQDHQPGTARLSPFAYEEIGALANDFVQETLEIIFKKLDRFNGSGSLAGWATSIALHQAGQELRRKYWHSEEALPDQPEQIEKIQARFIVREDPAANLLRVEMLAEVMPKVEECLAALLERYRIAFWGIIVLERSTQEIADELQVSANSVYILLCRAKKSLRKCLALAGIGAEVLEVYDDLPTG